MIKIEISALLGLSGIPHVAQLSNLAKYLTTSRQVPLGSIKGEYPLDGGGGGGGGSEPPTEQIVLV